MIPTSPQSARYDTGLDNAGLMPLDEVLEDARAATRTSDLCGQHQNLAQKKSHEKPARVPLAHLHHLTDRNLAE